MATNAPLTYGRDLACFYDADELFTDAIGLDAVRQDAFHRITTDDVLGDDGTGSMIVVGWGFDCRRLLGLPASRLAAHGPILARVLNEDPRILTADVTITATTTNGLADVSIRIVCTTALGPFELVIKSVQALAAGDLSGQS